MFRAFGFVALLAAALFAASPTVTSGVNYDASGGIITISSTANHDTLVATDSSLILSSFTGQAGFEPILAIGPITGGGADSVRVFVYADCYGPSGDIISRETVDSIKTVGGVCPGKYISLLLPPAYKYDVKLVGLTGNGGQVILNRMYVFFRKVITFTK